MRLQFHHRQQTTIRAPPKAPGRTSTWQQGRFQASGAPALERHHVWGGQDNVVTGGAVLVTLAGSTGPQFNLVTPAQPQDTTTARDTQRRTHTGNCGPGGSSEAAVPSSWVTPPAVPASAPSEAQLGPQSSIISAGFDHGGRKSRHLPALLELAAPQARCHRELTRSPRGS